MAVRPPEGPLLVESSFSAQSLHLAAERSQLGALRGGAASAERKVSLCAAGLGCTGPPDNNANECRDDSHHKTTNGNLIRGGGAHVCMSRYVVRIPSDAITFLHQQVFSVNMPIRFRLVKLS